MVLFAFASPVEATFAHIATASGASSNTTSVTTGNIDTTAGGGAALIVCNAAWYSTNGTDIDATISDSASNTGWVQKTVRTGVTYSGAIWYKISPTTNASHNFTLTDTSSIYPSLQCSALSASGTVTYEAESGFGHASGGNTSIQPGSITPSGSGRLFVAGLVFSPDVSGLAVDSSFTIGAQTAKAANNEGGAIAYKASAGSGAENPSWSWTGGATAAATMVTFMDGGGGGATPCLASLLGVGC